MASIKDVIKKPGYYIILFYGKLIPKTLKWDEKYLKKLYRYNMKKNLNIKNPQTFNEKLQWLKLHDRKDIYITMVDKYEVKEYVKNIIGEEYIIPTIGVWDNFDDIDFDKLPNQFVLKCTHDSGGLVIVTDKEKFDKDKARKKINHCLKRKYYLNTREWPYKNVKPRIIAEKYMVDESGYELKDYKLMCFDGKVELSFVCSNRNSRDGLCVNFYDKEWQPMPFIRKYPRNKVEIMKPKGYNEMVKLSEKLSKNIPFVRVDFYQVKEKIYFGELTFYPGSGMEWFKPEEWDYKIGKLLKLFNGGDQCE